MKCITSNKIFNKYKKLVILLILFAFIIIPGRVKAEDIKESYLDTGVNVKSKLRNLSHDYNANNGGPIFRKATKEEYEAVDKGSFNSNNKISLSNSPYPTYAWSIDIDEKENLVYYSEADKIYLNPNSSQMFYYDGYYGIRFSSIDISGLDASKVTNMEKMFSSLYGSESILKEVYLGDFDARNVTNMSSLFASREKLEKIDYSSFKTSDKLTSAMYMFNGCKSLTSLDLSDFDTSNITNMSNMFSSCSSLTELDVSNFDTSNATNMSNMFSGCSSLTELDVSSFDTSNVTNMSGMFSGCSSLTSLDLSNFDTSNVKNFDKMFRNMNNVENIDLSSFEIYDITSASMSLLFENCFSLKSIDLSGFDTSNITDMNSMFRNCYSLTTLDLSNFNTSNVTNMNSMFDGSRNLQTIFVSELFTTEKVKYSDNMFYNCNNLYGQQGSHYENGGTGVRYARVDDAENGNPGNFTYKDYKPRIFYPDGTIERVDYGYLFTFPSNSKDDEAIATVTFNYHDGVTPSTTSNVTRQYTFNNWKVRSTEYEPSDTITVRYDIHLKASYIKTTIGAEFPEDPVLENNTFLGWFSEPIYGNEYESYNQEKNITLYAHWENPISDNNLNIQEINITNGSISPEFDNGINAYELLLNKNIKDFNLEVVPESSFTTVEGDGTITKKDMLYFVVTLTSESGNTREVVFYYNKLKLFDYTGDVQEFIAPKSGIYKLETWGAQGGNYKNVGGYGAYSVGIVQLKRNDKLYINVGGQPEANSTQGGYNGGGNGGDFGGQKGSGGGGATHISTKNGLLSTHSNDLNSLLIVSGGGSGGGYYYSWTDGTGSGGGIKGNDGYDFHNNSTELFIGTGGTQTSGGICVADSNYSDSKGLFGKGGNNYHVAPEEYGGPGGGAGFYGGGGSNRQHASAGGGSGYIGSTSLLSDDITTKHMTCYNCETSDAESTKTISNTCHNEDPTEDCSKEGNGYARITFIRATEAKLKPGNDINEKITELNASGEFRKATYDEYETIYNSLNEDNIISIDDSPITYMWKIENDIVYYSEVEKIYMNEDSSNFFKNSNLTEIDLSGLDETIVEDASSMFESMNNLITVYVNSTFDLSNVTESDNMFNNSEKIMGYLGTEYNNEHINKEYAIIDTEEDPGYLTDVSKKGETHSVTFPDGTVEIYNHNSIITLEENTTSDDAENISTVTFKYHDGITDDSIGYVQMTHPGNGYKVNDVHYDDNSDVRINEDKVIEYEYKDELVGVEFPEPTRTGYTFLGWYTEETGGEKIESYSLEADITLHAHWEVIKKTITTLDGEEEVSYGTEYNLGTNDVTKLDEELSTVTFKYHNGNSDTTSNVTKTYAPNGWLVNDVHYDDEVSFEVTEDVTIEPDYIETVIGAEFPGKPKKESLAFTGWYDEETGGNKYTSYSEEEDIVLHAQYTDDIITINIPGEEPEIIPNGEEYELPNNTVEKDSEEVATVTFKLHNEEDDIVKNVTKEYTPNGWLINGVHYDDGDTITPTEDITLVPDYTESLVGVEFPNNPTKDEDVFIGWYDEETDGNKYTSYNEEEDIELHAQYDSNYAYLKEGTLIFEHVSKSLTGEFRKAAEEEYNEVKDTLTSDNIISDDTSRVPVYMWESDSNVYYYSEASIIFTNVNSKSMFEGARFSSIDLSGLNTSKTEDMSFMFNNCSQATSINVSNFDTSNVTTMYYMFASSRRLTSLDISSFDTRNVINMSYAFAFLERLSSLNVSNLNTSKVENMNSIFSGDSNLYELDLSTWDTSNVNDMSNMFNGCSRIASLNLYNLDVSNVRTFYNMFNEMSNLESITMSNYYNRKVTNMYNMFQGCKKLQTVDISNINAKRVENISYAFSRTNKLTTIYATKNAWPVLENAQGDFVFATVPLLVGGQGTAYDSSKINKTYAIVDDPDNGNPGYFTDASTIRTQHNVTFHYYTGDVVEKHNHDTIMTLEENNFSKPVEVLGTITFKYHDGKTDDSTLGVIKSYEKNGWLVNGVHYDDKGKVLIDEDKEINYDYLSESTGDVLPIPTRDGYEFLGWYTEEAGGDKVESYDGEDDIVLHAHWDMTLPTDITVDINDLTMVPNDIHQIVVTFIPEGTEDTITYTGYEDTIISVSQDGIITALSKGTTTITVGTENTDITKEITVTVLSDKLESDSYSVTDKVRPKENEEDPDITDRIIIGAEPLTTILEFKDNLINDNEYIYIYDLNDNLLSDDDIVRTGLKIKLIIDDNILDEAIMIVRGDIDGDGYIDVTDEAYLMDHILEIEELTGYKFYAADLEEDELLDVSDEAKLMDYILEIVHSLNE